jgi:DSBA-like thioredoxin domain
MQAVDSAWERSLRRAGIEAFRFHVLWQPHRRARRADPAVKERLKSSTDEAVRRGAFGAPTMFVDDQMFFGQDRLDFVREALGGPPDHATH